MSQHLDMDWLHSYIHAGPCQSHCHYCDKHLQGGGVTLLKYHLAGVNNGRCIGCPSVPPSVRDFFVEMLKRPRMYEQGLHRPREPLGIPLPPSILDSTSVVTRASSSIPLDIPTPYLGDILEGTIDDEDAAYQVELHCALEKSLLDHVYSPEEELQHVIELSLSWDQMNEQMQIGESLGTDDCAETVESLKALLINAGNESKGEDESGLDCWDDPNDESEGKVEDVENGLDLWYQSEDEMEVKEG